MIDPALSEKLALLLSGGAGDAAAPPAGLELRADRAAERIAEVTGLQPVAAIPRAEWLDRGAWASANLSSTAGLLDPLLDNVGEHLGRFAGPARTGVSYLASAEIGVLLGIVGRRVLGQYELAFLDPSVPARLLFVGPNIDAVADGMEVDRDELADWVVFHEVTHAVQFGGVPWLREHVAALLREVLGELEIKIDAKALARMPTSADLRALADAVREGGLALAVVGPERRALLERVQAIMALVEGHAEWTMDAAARDVLPSLDQLRSALDARRRDRPPALRLLDKLLGLELKLRQYQEGRAFCDAVVAAGGTAALRQAWRSPDDAPTMEELRSPDRWLARQGLRAA
jgi:coenzyme F420 biosynthesis associated uncharacterized protein